MNRLRTTGGWASLIGLLIAVGIAAVLYIYYLQSDRPARELTGVDEATSQALKENDIDTSTRGSAYQSTMSQIDKINEQNKSRGEDLMRQIGDMQQY